MMHKQLLLEELQPASKNDLQLHNNQFQFKSPSLISKYNLFVRCYNTECNRIDEESLTFIQQSKIFNSFSLILLNKKLKTLFFFLLVIPFLNFLILSYLFIVIYRYYKCLKIYRKNEKRVSNPFGNMKFDPQKCRQLNRNFHFMTINFKNLRPQFNFKENIQLTESQGKSGTKSKWMIYNEEFASYHNDLPKWRIKFVFLLFAAIILTLGSFIFILLMI